MYTCRILLSLISLGFSVWGTAQEAGDTLSYKPKLTLLPNLGYSPDTRLVVGAFGLFQFKPGNAGLETRSSNVMASLAYTFKDQLSFETYFNLVFPDEKWLWNGDFFSSAGL